MDAPQSQNRFREFLRNECDRRRSANPAYSLRAYAQFLGIDHSTLSQVLRGNRPLPTARIGSIRRKLGLLPEEIAVFRAAELVPDRQTEARYQQIRHWTAEALLLLDDRVHQDLLALCGDPDFQADLRWVATRLGVDIDRVTLALQRLLRLELLQMTGTGQWQDTYNLGSTRSIQFRRAVLGRIRAMSPVHLPVSLKEAR